MKDKLDISTDRLAEFCEQNHVKKLAIFGSAIRDDFGPKSDVDILVDFLPNHTPGFFGLIEMEEKLSDIFGQRQIDLRTPQDLSRHFRDKVVAAAEVKYVQG